MNICRSQDCGRKEDRILKDGYCLICNKKKSISKEMLFQAFQPASKQLGGCWEVKGSQPDNFKKLFKFIQEYQDNKKLGHDPLDWMLR